MNHRTYAPNQSSIESQPATSDNEKRLQIEEVTARAGVSERLVRQCEARGLLLGVKHTDSSRRRYTHDDVCVLRFARQTHILGFGMNEVARLLFLWQGMHRINFEEKTITLSQPKQLKSNIDELQAMECLLKRLKNRFSDEHHPTCPILDDLMELKLLKT